MLHIDTLSFFKKGLIYNDDYDISLILGAQGTGKTYFGVKYVIEFLQKNSNYTLKTNIKSLYENLKNVRKVEYFETIRDICDDFTPFCIYFIDELARKYPKNCPQDTKFLGWLMQSRKCHRYVIMTHQTYLLVPQWLREPIVNVYTTHHFVSHNICITEYGKPLLDEDTLDWTIVPQDKFIYKRNIVVSSMYDTFEPVAEL